MAQAEAESDTRTLISYNRPLTRGAKKALAEYGIVDERSINEHGHWTEVDVEEAPPEELLEKHELAFEDPTGGADPVAIYETDRDERVEIYPDVVYIGGVHGEKQAIDPEEACEYAENNGWERIDDE